MNFEKHSPLMMVVAVTLREQKMDPNTYRFTFTGNDEVVYMERGEVTIQTLRDDYPTRFVSAEVIGTFISEWYQAWVSHGIKDGKGRELGHRFTITRERDGWELRPHATRAGATFGALQPRIKCASLADAQAKAEQLAAQAKARAVKNAAKNGGTYRTGK